MRQFLTAIHSHAAGAAGCMMAGVPENQAAIFGQIRSMASGHIRRT
jgi:hypothetical protein